MDTGRDAMRLSPLDNVATALRPISPGEEVRFGDGEAVLALDAIPLCHKIALRPIAGGGDVLKYGHPIGVALRAIAPGRHVHVHVMRSARAAPAGAAPSGAAPAGAAPAGADAEGRRDG